MDIIFSVLRMKRARKKIQREKKNGFAMKLETECQTVEGKKRRYGIEMFC